MHGIRVSHSKVYHIQVKRDDCKAGRPNTHAIRPLPQQAQFRAVGKRGERHWQHLVISFKVSMPFTISPSMPWRDKWHKALCPLSGLMPLVRTGTGRDSDTSRGRAPNATKITVNVSASNETVVAIVEF